jgi:hypothetical protein
MRRYKHICKHNMKNIRFLYYEHCAFRGPFEVVYNFHTLGIMWGNSGESRLSVHDTGTRQTA